MELKDLILAIVGATEKVEGRKRLQKIVHLLQEAGTDVKADFRLHHYGPFSDDVVTASELLVLFGELEEEQEPAGAYQTYQYLYRLPSSASHRVNTDLKRLIQALNKFSTSELEVASTIAFYESHGADHSTAIEKTQFMKPNKAIPPVIRKAEEILRLVQQQKVRR